MSAQVLPGFAWARPASMSEIHSIKEQLLKYEALGALMSGSGPSVFGIFSEAETARNARDTLARNSGWQVYLADLIVDSGIRIDLT